VAFLIRFRGTVRGLAPGAPVEVRGIRIGEATNVGVDYVPDSNSFVAPVGIVLQASLFPAAGPHPRTPAEVYDAAVSSGNEICRMDAVTLAEKIRTRQLSPIEVTDAVIARMEKLNPVLGAFCTPTPDVARQRAKAVEADIMAGRPVGQSG
jgi:hypothetical protein